MATPNPVAVNTSITISANVDDTTTGNSKIAAASYTINDGAAISMAAADGTFESPVEDVIATSGAGLPVGVYDVCVSGSDAAGNTGAAECVFLAVYDPDAGFVTGSGWIQSPPGAYVPDPLLTGKARFVFVSKYQKGQSLPTGNTQFQFKAGDLSFDSDSYEWLVVAGARAQYKGVGTINGSGNHGFMLTAIDAELTPNTVIDRFRIKIWDKDNGDAIVYDNELGADDSSDPSTEIAGGSIVVHTPKEK